jgi:hypothetical protein
MPGNVIEFLGSHVRDHPPPFPANQDIPGWFKQMPAEATTPGDEPTLTLKKCPPFLDAMTSGYLIPVCVDIQFEMEPDGLRFATALPILEVHPLRQIAGAPFAGRQVVVKFLNPWIVRTAPGYSSLFVQPLNRFDIPFHVLAGVVETDVYYREVNFPAICMLQPGQKFLLKKGTPIVQVIPILRESCNFSLGHTDTERRKVFEKGFEGAAGHYKEHYWQRKEFR